MNTPAQMVKLRGVLKGQAGPYRLYEVAPYDGLPRLFYLYKGSASIDSMAAENLGFLRTALKMEIVE